MADPIPKVLLSAGMIQGGLSGVGRYVVELAQRITQMNTVDLHVAGLDADRSLFDKLDDAHWVTIPESASGGFKNLAWHQQKLPSILKAGGYQLLHIPSYRRIVAFCPVPQLVTIHDCAPFRLRDKYGALRGLFGRQVAPWMARRCEHVLTVSEFTKQDLIDYFKLPSEGIDVVYNGLNHGLYHPRSDEEQAAFCAKQGIEAPFLLFISRLEHPGKNHVRLIEAYEAYRKESGQRHLLVLGGAPWHGAEVIEERVRQSPFAADIRMPGFIEEADLPLWYASADGLVFPSLIEGFGLPVVEALACACRVASSDRGSLPEVGGDAAIYFDPEQVPDIARAIKDLCAESPSERDERLAKGTTHASKFDWDQAAMATCQSYLKTIKMV